ncbi:MAG: sugar phosphate nucleotidyltransferase, partial [Pseudonocardiaceae bacterium]
YRNEAFVELFPDARAGSVHLSYAIEPEPLDTGGAIGFAARQAGIDEPFVVANGDVLTDLDVSAMIAFHRSSSAKATIALARVSDPSAFGLVHADDHGRVIEFTEKPPAGGDIRPGWVNAGTYVLDPAILDHIPVRRRVSVEREVFPKLVADQCLFSFASDDYWTDTGTPGQYLAAHLDLVDGRRGAPPAPNARQVGPDLWMMGEATIDGEVVGPALVGHKCHIAVGSRVQRSVLGAGSKVDSGASVSGSVLLAGVLVHAGAVVRDSIVGPGATIGAGAVVSGLSVIGSGVHVPVAAVLDGQRVPEGAS